MKPRLAVIFAVIVILPLVILAWLGVRVTLNEREATRSRFREVLLGRLKDVDADVVNLLAERERDILKLYAATPLTPDDARSAARRSP